MTTTTSDRLPSFFINRNFALLWLGQAVSILGDYIFSATLVFWIGTRIAQGQSWAPLAVSGLLIATAIPTIVIGPLAGVFVDRWDKRWTMLTMDICRAILNLLLLIMTTGSIIAPFIVPSTQLGAVLQLAEIYSIVFLMTACTQFFNPASVAVLSSIVAKDDLTRATGRQQAVIGLATILGLSLSAPLFFGLGVQWVLLINSFSFLLSFVSILAIHLPETSTQKQIEQKNNFIQEFKEGLHFYTQNTALITILISTSLFIIGAGTVNTLNFFFITENLHLPAAMFSYINAAFGAGAIIGSIIAIWGARRLGPRNMFWISLLLSGFLLIFYARNTSPILTLFIFFLLGMPNAVNNAMLSPLLLSVTPGNFVGRVVAVLLSTITLVRILSMALVGYLDSNVLGNFRATFFNMRFSAIDLLFIVAGLLTIIASFYAKRYLQTAPGIDLEDTSNSEANSA